MSSFKQLFAALAAFMLVAVSAAMPAHLNTDAVDLAVVMNQTVCPIEVHLDVDMKRVPQRIKMLKCGAQPLQGCARLGVPAHECCQRRRGGARLACAELEDAVEVFYPQAGVAQQYRVSVGCSCVIETDEMLEEPTP